MHGVQRMTQSVPTHDAQRLGPDAPEISPSSSTTHAETSARIEQMRSERMVNATTSPPQKSTRMSLKKRTKRMSTFRHPPSCDKPEDQLAPGTSAPCVEQFTPTMEMLPRGFIAAPAVQTASLPHRRK